MNAHNNVDVVTSVINELECAETFEGSGNSYAQALFTSLAMSAAGSYAFHQRRIEDINEGFTNEELTDDQVDMLKRAEAAADEALAAYAYYFHNSGANPFCSPEACVQRQALSREERLKTKLAKFDPNSEDAKEYMEDEEMDAEELMEALQMGLAEALEREKLRVAWVERQSQFMIKQLESAIATSPGFEISDDKYISTLKRIRDKVDTYRRKANNRAANFFDMYSESVVATAKANKRVFKALLPKVEELLKKAVQAKAASTDPVHEGQMH